jgi:chromosome segregation ATPase
VNEATGNLVLEHLRHIRTAVDEIRLDLKGLKSPISLLEQRYASISNRIGCIEDRLERIERRIGLIEA